MDNKFFDDLLDETTNNYFNNLPFEKNLLITKDLFHSIWKDKHTMYSNTESFSINKNVIEIRAKGWEQSSRFILNNAINYDFSRDNKREVYVGNYLFLLNYSKEEIFKQNVRDYFEEYELAVSNYNKTLLLQAKSIEEQFLEKYRQLLFMAVDKIPDFIFLDLDNYKDFMFQTYKYLCLPLSVFSDMEKRIINGDESREDNSVLEHMESLFRLFKMIAKKEPDWDLTLLAINFYVLLKNIIVEYFSLKWEKTYGRIQEPYIKNYCSNTLISHLDKGTAYMFLNYLLDKGEYKGKSFIDAHNDFVRVVLETKENIKQVEFEKNFDRETEKNCTSITIDEIDLMTGEEFESFISKLFKKIGYNTFSTKKTGDQGIDVIAEKNTIRIGIQAKCWSGTVGNSAVQEVVAGKTLYNCNKVMVVTNSVFSKSAIELATANNVILWDRSILKEKIEKI